MFKRNRFPRVLLITMVTTVIALLLLVSLWLPWPRTFYSTIVADQRASVGKLPRAILGIPSNATNGVADHNHNTWELSQGSVAIRKMFQYVLSTAAGVKQDAGPTKPVRLLCWILTDPFDLEKRTKHVKNTWAKRCDVTLYMSSERNDTFPTVGLNVPAGRNHIASKSRAAWTYVYKNYFDQADFFLKADPDTYMVVENLREYLAHRDASKAEYYGHGFRKPSWSFTYMSGGSGLIISREALRRLVKHAFTLKKNCMPDGQGEDWKTADCLARVGASPVDTRDSMGKERFLVFNPVTHISGRYPNWFIKRSLGGAPKVTPVTIRFSNSLSRQEESIKLPVNLPVTPRLTGEGISYIITFSGTEGQRKGSKCCSDYPVAFHYIKPEEMYVLEYFLYHARPHGKEMVNL